MIIDTQVLFSEAQVITATAVSTNSLDLGAPGIAPYRKNQLKRNMDKSQKIPLLIQVVQSFNTLTSLKIDVEMAIDEAFTAPVIVASELVLLADLKAGYICPIEKVPRGITMRYLRLKYTVAGTAPTLGQITAGIVAAVDGAYVG